MFAQTEESVIVTDSFNDLSKQLSALDHKSEQLRKLTIIISDNYGWHTFITKDGKIDPDYSRISLKRPMASLPEEIGKFKNLEYLDISNLGLERLDEIKGLSKLKSLNVGFNSLNIEGETELLTAFSELERLILIGCEVPAGVVERLRTSRKELRILYEIEEIYSPFYKTLMEEKKKHIKPNETLTNLLKEIGRYYPLGMPALNETFEGYQKIKDIVVNRTEEVNQGKHGPWKILADKVKARLNTEEVHAIYGSQLPLDQLIIDLDDDIVDQIRKRRTIFISRSLLCQYYTIYFRTDFFFEEYKLLGRPVYKLIIYGEETGNDSEKDIMMSLKQLVQEDFPDYTFVRHGLLFKQKISGGLPYGESFEYIKPEYPIYSFLFGNSPASETTILD
ncbi:MAG: hypothetical protein RIM99_17935 [Cyclobacteriaceae bacterium]